MNKLGGLVGQPIHSVPKQCKDLVLPDAKVGIEVELEMWDGTTPEAFWDRHPDEGSLKNHGMEFVTHGGMVGEDIQKALTIIFTQALKRKWSTGYPRAGIHIHLDVTDLDMDEKELATLVCNYMIVEHILFGFAGEHRRACGFCVAYEDSQVDFNAIGRLLFKNLDAANFRDVAAHLSKYQALNLNPLVRFGTIEFRHLPTTFSVERVMLWINMILAIKKSVSIPECKEPLLTLSRIGAEEYCKLILGPTWNQVSRFFNVMRVWHAVDNAQALMAMSGLLKHEGGNATWGAAVEPSPYIEMARMKVASKLQRAKERT
jgi:hypothetical protein